MQSRPALAIGGFLLTGLSYLVGSFAVNNGSLWFYFFTLAFLITGLRLIAHSLKNKV